MAMRTCWYFLPISSAIFVCGVYLVYAVVHHSWDMKRPQSYSHTDEKESVIVVWPKLVLEDRGRTKRSYQEDGDMRSGGGGKGGEATTWTRAAGSEKSGKNVQNPLDKQAARRGLDTASIRPTSRTAGVKKDDYYLYSINAFHNRILLNLSRFTAHHGLTLSPGFLVQHYNNDDNFTWFERRYHQQQPGQQGDHGSSTFSNFSLPPQTPSPPQQTTSTKNDSTENNDDAADVLSPIDRCLYIGRVVVESDNEKERGNGGGTLLNLCHGMYGTLELPEGTYFLEPLFNETNEQRRIENGEDTGTDAILLPHDQPHLLYRHRSQTFHDGHGTKRGTVTSKRRSPFTSLASSTTRRRHRHRNGTIDEGNTEKLRPKRSYSWDHYIEVLVVADARMKQYHGSNLENYVLTLLSIVATIYRHPSLEAALNIVVVRLIVLDHDNAGPHISENAQDTLKQFCRWQQSINDPDDESINHHDVAILLTRNDICRAPGKCDTLGLAELGTMCDSYRSCAIIEDNGLSAAFTIAHELGHIFNIPHDDEKKCSHHMALDKYNFHIMAPTLEFNTHPWSWSPCSAAMLHKFLESGRAHCLLDKPVQQKYVERASGNPAPGLSFTVDQQCQFVFGSSATLCPYMPACKRLWCTTVYQYQVGCRTQHMPWADGTPCGNSRWCYRGECVGVSPAQMTPIDGGWGRWKEWGECSRTCGGGVMRSLRECDNPRPNNGGRYCIGERVRFRSCNTKECPLDTPDFREVQCADFNNKRVGIHGLPNDVRWVPKYSGISTSDRCKLYCRVDGSAAFYMLKDKVIDGTQCGRYSDDMCVDGVCRKAGCNHRLDSTMSRDNCGICGGDGLSCRRVSGNVNDSLTYGYNHVMTIPTGAATIEIRQRSWNKRHDDDNYLALMNSKGEFILNGGFQISAYHVEIPVRGTVLHYSGSESAVERINSSRPAMEDLYVHVLSVGQLHAPDIHYDYAISDRPFLTMKTPDHFWRATEEWSECDKPCHGTQSKRMVCVEAYDEEIVNERHCDGQPKPNDHTKTCNIHCQLKWLTESTSECSAVCGAGEQSQRSFCMAQSSGDGSRQMVDERYCLEMASRPPHRIQCYKDCAGRQWAYGEWEQCSASCGGGKQKRTATCIDHNKARLDSRYCKNLISEPVMQDCNIFPCPDWHYGDWSECSHSCDGGTQVRLSMCHDASGREVDIRFCDHNQRFDRRKCNEQLCTSWKFSTWSQCSRTCGDGVQTREAWCVDSKGNALDEGVCEKAQKIVSKSCLLTECPQLKVSKWSQCSRTCLDGWKSRRVQCVDNSDQELDLKFCLGKGEQQPPTHEMCNLGPCPFWKMHDWGPCSVSCGSGQQTRTVECVHRGEVVDTGYCHDQQQPSRVQPCTLIACPEWETGSWDSCSVPCGEGKQTRSVRCRYVESGHTADENMCNAERKPKNIRPCKKAPCSVKTTTTPTITTRTTTKPTTTRPTTPRTSALPRRAVPPIAKSNDAVPPTSSYRPTQWVSGAWSECSTSCGSGERVRLVICRDVFGRVLPDLYCSHEAKLSEREFCSGGPCSTGGKWHFGPWERCPATCGEGHYAIRRVVCVAQSSSHANSALAPSNILDPSLCSNANRPSDRHPCRLPACPMTTMIPKVKSENEVNGNGYYGSWKVGEWGPCTKTCNGGWQSRRIACVSEFQPNISIAKLIGPVDLSCPFRKPKSLRPCNKIPCPGEWVIGDWGQCNKSCGGGYQRRNAECVDTEFGRPLPSQRCHRERPAQIQTCNSQRCQRLVWRTGKWSACSATCGRGMRTREVQCVDDYQSNGTEQYLNETLCILEQNGTAGEKPPIFHRCRMAKCPKWKRGKWSLCSVTCGEGIRTRSVVCAQGRRNVLSDEKCTGQGNKPLENARCQRPQCPVYHWLTTRWSKCSEICGEGRQYREVYCVNNYRQRAPPSLCNSQQKPPSVQTCVSSVCPYTWMPGPWSTCSKSCGDGEQFRTLHCQLKLRKTSVSVGRNDVLHVSAEDVQHDENGPQVPSYHCAALPQPTVRRSCSLGSCQSDYYWHVESWSQCTVSCGWGMQTRRVRCLSKETGRSVRGRCSPLLRPKRRRRCFLRNCESGDCSEVRQMFNTTTDGHYEILVSGRKVQIFCHGMNESHPKEYLTLRTGQRTNYAEFYGKRLLYPFTCPHNGERNDSCQCTSEGNPRPGLTRFTKVRIDLQNMKINVMDRQFAITEFGDFIPYGTAGDCYSAVNCPQGQFGIDLRTTGFKVSEKTEWQEDGHRTSKHITKYENGAAVQGRCGGYCGKCYPSKRYGLLVELDPKQLK